MSIITMYFPYIHLDVKAEDHDPLHTCTLKYIYCLYLEMSPQYHSMSSIEQPFVADQGTRTSMAGTTGSGTGVGMGVLEVFLRFLGGTTAYRHRLHQYRTLCQHIIHARIQLYIIQITVISVLH